MLVRVWGESADAPAGRLQGGTHVVANALGRILMATAVLAPFCQRVAVAQQFAPRTARAVMDEAPPRRYATLEMARRMQQDDLQSNDRGSIPPAPKADQSP